MSTLSLRVKYRPIRIGWCLEGGNRDQLRRALRLTHSFAGGRFNPLIPVDAPELAEDLLDRFRVDVLFPLEESEEISGFIKGHDYLRWPEFGRRNYSTNVGRIGRRTVLLSMSITSPDAFARKTSGRDQSRHSAVLCTRGTRTIP